MNWRVLILFLAAGLLAGGCRKDSPPVPPPPAAELALPTQAQPKLRTIRIWLGAEEMAAEVAVTPEQVRAGMMFRTNLEENAGMLFVFGQPSQPSFWMKNCPLALSAAYIDPAGIILELHDFQPQDTNPVVAVANTVQYALEVRRGWFERHHIGNGTLVRTERGSFPETFLVRRGLAP
jgi:hypothetical protein